MTTPGFQPGLRRSMLRHWLLLCVIAVLGQTGTSELAWCLHDAEPGAHLESALNDCADHTRHHPDPEKMSCHDSGSASSHLMLDALDPGKVTPSATTAHAAALPAFELRLSIDDWLPPARGSDQAGPWLAPRAPDLANVGQLVGHTTHLLI